MFPEQSHAISEQVLDCSKRFFANGQVSESLWAHRSSCEEYLKSAFLSVGRVLHCGKSATGTLTAKTFLNMSSFEGSLALRKAAIQKFSVSYPLRRRKKLIDLLRIVSSHPGGISTSELVKQSYGAVRLSVRSGELEQARMNATRKLIQRANEVLKQCNSSDTITFCKVKKVWLLKDAL